MTIQAQNLLNVVAATSAQEGTYADVNPNTDGQGVSWGIIQWTQRSGNLGELLRACRAADQATFDAVFGGSAAALVAQTTSSSESVRMSPVGGVLLWVEPWVSRFRAAGGKPVFQQVQLRMATTGSHMQAARAIWEPTFRSAFTTERTLALVYDTAANQGSGAVKTVRDRFLASWRAEGVVSYRRVLELWCLAAASRYRQREPRDGWEPGGDGWYYKYQYKRRVYDRVLERQRRIAGMVDLSDLVIS